MTSPLTQHEITALKLIQSISCKHGTCDCVAWTRDIADNLRLACPTVDDATLVHVVMQVIGNAGRYVLTHRLTAVAANDLLARTAAELAAAELEHE